MGILMLLMFIPIFTYPGGNFSSESGLRELFDVGVSHCNKGLDESYGEFTLCESRDLITAAGWHQKLRNYVLSSCQSDKGEQLNKKLLWLFVPDWEKDGQMSSITSIPAEKGRKNKLNVFTDDPDVYWKQTDACAGFKVSKDCYLREQEM